MTDHWAHDFFSEMTKSYCFSSLTVLLPCVQPCAQYSATTSLHPPFQKNTKKQDDINLPLLQAFMKLAPCQCVSPWRWNWVTASDMWPSGRYINGHSFSLWTVKVLVSVQECPCEGEGMCVAFCFLCSCAQPDSWVSIFMHLPMMLCFFWWKIPVLLQLGSRFS